MELAFGDSTVRTDMFSCYCNDNGVCVVTCLKV